MAEARKEKKRKERCGIYWALIADYFSRIEVEGFAERTNARFQY